MELSTCVDLPEELTEEIKANLDKLFNTVCIGEYCESHTEIEDGIYKLAFGDELNGIKIPIVSDVVNVEQPNDKTVFVQFADGTKEVAVCSPEDTFNFETGVLICLFKKLVGDKSSFFGVTGSTLYNKLIKYALSKKDATKIQRQKERKRNKECRKELHDMHCKAKEFDNKLREDRIREMKEAFLEAFEEYDKTKIARSVVTAR